MSHRLHLPGLLSCLGYFSAHPEGAVGTRFWHVLPVVLEVAEGSPSPSGGCSVGCSLPAADSPPCCFAACKRRCP